MKTTLFMAVLAVVGFATYTNAGPKASKKTFEYKCIRAGDGNADSVEPMLNAQGKEGWELVTADSSQWTYCFKR